MKPVKIRKVVFRKDTFLQKLSRINSSLMINNTEVIKDIKIMNNSIMLDVAPIEKKNP